MNRPPLLLGHRGLRSSTVTENSIEAFELALQHGCDGFEFDVRLTADGHALVCHDPRSGGLFIAQKACSQFEHLPSLKGVLKHFSKCAFVDIELKVPGLEQQTLEMIERFPPARGYLISSFIPEVLVELRRLSETASLGILFDKRQTDWRTLSVQYVLPKRSLLTHKLVDEVHRAGKGVMTWTVNDKASMLRFASWGVDGIISDRPKLLITTLRPHRLPNSISLQS